MKRGRRVLLILLGCGAVALVAALVWPREREPVYQGKKLSEWLEVYSFFSVHPFPTDPERIRADDAVYAIGTNATPWLLKWVGHEEGRWTRAMLVTATKLPEKSLRSRILRRYVLRRYLRAMSAMVVFDVLGPKAMSAVPELTRMSQATDAPHSASRADYCVKVITAYRPRSSPIGAVN